MAPALVCRLPDRVTSLPLQNGQDGAAGGGALLLFLVLVLDGLWGRWGLGGMVVVRGYLHATTSRGFDKSVSATARTLDGELPRV